MSRFADTSFQEGQVIKKGYKSTDTGALLERDRLDGPYTVTDSKLWKFNKIGCILHGIQGLLLMVASQAVESIKAFKIEITTSYLVFDNSTQALRPWVPLRSSLPMPCFCLPALVLILCCARHRAGKRETLAGSKSEYALQSSC